MEDYIKVLNFQPHKLPENYITDPDYAIKIFFSVHSIPQARQNIYSLFRTWIKHINVYAEPSDILGMLLFHEQLIEFLEVSYIKGVKDGYLPKPTNEP